MYAIPDTNLVVQRGGKQFGACVRGEVGRRHDSVMLIGPQWVSFDEFARIPEADCSVVAGSDDEISVERIDVDACDLSSVELGGDLGWAMGRFSGIDATYGAVCCAGVQGISATVECHAVKHLEQTDASLPAVGVQIEQCVTGLQDVFRGVGGARVEEGNCEGA